MYQQTYYVPKVTGTLSDALMAFGAARLLNGLADRATGRTDVVTLFDDGVRYRLELSRPVTPAWVEAMAGQQLVPFVETAKEKRPEDLPLLATRSVEAEYATLKQMQELRKSLKESKMPAREIPEYIDQQIAQPTDWTVVTYLGDYRMQALDIHNKLVVQWARSEAAAPGLVWRHLLALLASPDPLWELPGELWKKESPAKELGRDVTASQLLNPHMGKGQNRAKANGLVMGNESSFWIAEYLKIAGLWAAAAPTKIQDFDLRKSYVLAPRQLNYGQHERVFANFRKHLRGGGAVKQDILASLIYVRELLHYAVEEDDVDLFDDGPISSLVSGMAVATYQLLSQNSYTTMNLAFLGLPDWMPAIRTNADAALFRDLLDEHMAVVNGLDDEKSEAQTLLLAYRDFVCGGDWDRFFDFCAGYSSYLLSAIHREQRYVKPFLSTNLRRLLEMNKPLFAPILANDGFRAVARAIRKSTLTPVYQGKSSRYEVRYGLGQELKRRSRYDDEFVTALGDFVQLYNEESMRVYERTKGESRRKLVTTDELESLIDLVDQHGARVVANLLVAYGYAREPRELDAAANAGPVGGDAADTADQD